MIQNIFKWGLLIVIFCSSINTALAFGPFQWESEMIGQRASGFTLKDNLGNTVDTSKFIGKKPIIFFFWTTWCPHCRRQISYLKGELENIKKAKAMLILVNISENEIRVSSFLRSANSTIPSLLDKDSQAAELYKVIGVPTYIIVGSDGIIKFYDYFLPDNYLDILTEKSIF